MSSVNKDEAGRNGGKGGNTGLIIGIVVAVIVILALVAVIIALVVSKKGAQEEVNPEPAVEAEATPEPENRERRNVVVTSDNVEEVIQQMEEAEFVEPGYYTVTMNNEWHFPDGKSASTDAYVENITENRDDVYFDLFLAGNEDHAIYESPVIPRGGVLESFALDTPLEAGSYDCIMIYHMVDENQNTLSTLRVTVTVIIEE